MKLRISTIFTLFFIFSLAGSSACFAFSKELQGKKADEFMSVLGIAPYISVGSGKKVVYVSGRYKCSTTRSFYQLSKKLHDEFEFRWLLEPHLARKKYDCIGLYENRSPEALENLIATGKPMPAQNKKTAMAQAALVEIMPEILAKLAGITDEYSLPVLAFRTKSSVQYISANQDILSEPKLRVLLAPALPDAKKVPFDTASAFTAVGEAKPIDGFFCGSGGAVQPRLLPNEHAPTFGTSLDPANCYYALTSVPGGWVGIKMSSKSKAVLGYVKKTEGMLLP